RVTRGDRVGNGRPRDESEAPTVPAPIRSWIRAVRRPYHAHAHRRRRAPIGASVPSRVVAISRLVYERNAIACFGQVDESVAVQLEPCGVPAGVLVSGPLDVAELDLRGGAIGADVKWERQFQDLLGLVPVQIEVKFDTAASGCQPHDLRDGRGTEGPVDPNRTNQRARFDDGERVALS